MNQEHFVTDAMPSGHSDGVKRPLVTKVIWAAVIVVLLGPVFAACVLIFQRLQQSTPEIRTVERLGGRLSLVEDRSSDFAPQYWWLKVQRAYSADQNQFVEGIRWDRSPIRDEDLRVLSAFPNLKSLYLENTRITSAGAAELKSLTKLEALSFRETNFDDAGLHDLSILPRLHWLDLSETLVTDAGLATLQTFPKLRTVYVAYTDATIEGGARLQAARPDCQILQNKSRSKFSARIRLPTGELIGRVLPSQPCRLEYRNLTTGHTLANIQDQISRSTLVWGLGEMLSKTDGQYEVQLEIGTLKSQIVKVGVKDGVLDPETAVFEMQP